MPTPQITIGPSNIMLDLETLGTVPGSIITAIGAVFFDENGLGAEFYARVNVKSCEAVGLVMDASTVLWWMEQTAEARRELCNQYGTEPLSRALDGFDAFVHAGCEAPKDVAMWGNGAAFDNVVLPHAYHVLGRTPPWKFWNDRCFRTLKALYPDVKLERGGVHHHALDDAKSQARHLVEIIKAARAS